MRQKRKIFLITQRNLSAETPAFCVHGLRLSAADRGSQNAYLPSQLQHYRYRDRHVQEYCTESISVLLETGLITVEPSSYFDRHGMKWKGNNLYTILPIHSAVGIFHQQQLRRLELDVARSRLAAQTAV